MALMEEEQSRAKKRYFILNDKVFVLLQEGIIIPALWEKQKRGEAYVKINGKIKIFKIEDVFSSRKTAESALRCRNLESAKRELYHANRELKKKEAKLRKARDRVRKAESEVKRCTEEIMSKQGLS